MSEQTQISDFSERDEKPESMKETFIPPELSTNLAEIIEDLMNCEDLFQDKDLTSRPSSTLKDKKSLYSLSQSSLDKDRMSIATSVWSSPASDISERISHDVQSEESRRASSTGIKKMSDSSQTEEEADDLMKCDDLLEDEAADLRLDLSSINEERSHTLSWGSLSWDSRTMVRGLYSRSSDDEHQSHQEEAEAGEVKQTDQSDPAPASSKTTISTRGKFFRWMKKNKIHPDEVDVSTGQNIKSPHCPPETCSSIEEVPRKVSYETKTKKGNRFTRFFRSIFSKNEKKLKQDKMENGQKKAAIKVPVEEQEVDTEETEDEVQSPNIGRSSPSSLQEDKIPSPQSQTTAGSVIQVEGISSSPRPSYDEDSSPQEEAEAGEVKQPEQSDSVTPASSKTTISTRGRLFRLKTNKIHPVEADVGTGQNIKNSDCPPETCSSIEEDHVDVSAETKMKKGNGFTRFFRRIFSKNEKKLKQDKMENGQKKKAIKVPVEEQEVHQEETEDEVQSLNFGRSSPFSLQEDKIPSPQSQTTAGSVVQMEVRIFSPRPSYDEDSSPQEEAEAGEVKQPEQSDSVTPASSKTTISTRGRLFRLKTDKIHPVEADVSTGQNMKISDCPPETCSSIEEDIGEVSAETKMKKGNGFIGFFRRIFSKKKLKQEENEQKKTHAEQHVTLSSFSWCGAVS
ncbi:uncharacterized protein LOC117824978 isoform X2 [Notolabrus celidotus]|uniref:uncharacterized protein LOC117824978 isoform X2 n=1 Tax=Notolabrus celidotus TaxID=1203425 RepID=UPI0014906DD5|nr:uncharacterized protein LOC117824978 isoform X2 [Notolabrus celidotus]